MALEHTDQVVEHDLRAQDAASIEERVVAQELAQLRVFARIVNRIANDDRLDGEQTREQLIEALKEVS